MFKGVKSKLSSPNSIAQGKATQSNRAATPMHRLARDNRGNSEMVAVLVLIVVVLVIAAVIFLPGMKDYFQNTVAPGMKTATQNLFNFGG